MPAVELSLTYQVFKSAANTRPISRLQNRNDTFLGYLPFRFCSRKRTFRRTAKQEANWSARPDLETRAGTWNSSGY